MKVGELIYELGFNADTTKLTEFVKMIGDLNMSSVMAATGFGGLYESIKNILEQTSKTAMDMQTFANVTGLSSQKMAQWGDAAEQFGVKSDTVKSSIKGLQNTLSSMAMGHPSQQFLEAMGWFSKAGVDMGKLKNVWDLYDRIIKNIDKIGDEGKQRQILAMLGLDETTLNLVRNREEYFKERDSRPVASTEAVSRLVELWKETVKAAKDFGVTLMDIGGSLAPFAEWILKISSGLLEAVHQSKVLQAVFIAMGVALLAIFGGPVAATIAGIVASITYITSHWDAIKKLAKDSYGSIMNNPNPIGLPEGVHMKLPAGVGYTGPANVNVHNETHVQTNNPDVASQLVKDAHTQAITEAHVQAGVKNR